jgi:hypothetical protein
VAYNRQLPKQFTSTHTTEFDNLLVSGCSFTYNNSTEHLCTWPYYLRDICGFNEVYDSSQAGAGSNHIFNSIINEVETNSNINAKNTLVIIMWSGLTRTDLIAETHITKSYYNMNHYNFDDKFSTLSLNSVFIQAPRSDSNPLVAKLHQLYKKIIPGDAQILESAFKIIALQSYLEKQGFKYIMLNWMGPTLNSVFIQAPRSDSNPLVAKLHQLPELNTLNNAIKESVLSIFDPVKTLGEYATNTRQTIPNDGHPTPDAHLSWTREYLIPYLESKKLIATG